MACAKLMAQSKVSQLLHHLIKQFCTPDCHLALSFSTLRISHLLQY